MSAMTAAECASRFIDRYCKLLTGEIVPGRNACDQPYDSDWEREFEYVLAKHIPDFVTLRNQVPFGKFRADFAFECSKTGNVWIVEFDGKTFHDARRDDQRDEIIFRNHPQVQAIVRVDAKTGQLEPFETMAILSMMLPACFLREYNSVHDWDCDGGLWTALIFDERHDSDSWWDDGAYLPGAPMVELKIQKKERP